MKSLQSDRTMPGNPHGPAVSGYEKSPQSGMLYGLGRADGASHFWLNHKSN